MINVDSLPAPYAGGATLVICGAVWLDGPFLSSCASEQISGKPGINRLDGINSRRMRSNTCFENSGIVADSWWTHFSDLKFHTAYFLQVRLGPAKQL